MTKKIFNQEVIGPQDFDLIIKLMRSFFSQKNYKEVYPQPIKSIMAACEDPSTLRTFEFDGNTWPLSQTNQLNLEMILLTAPEEADGIYCMTTSYRDEPNPIEGRHKKIFGMFEVEHKGDFQGLIDTLCNLCIHLGLVNKIEEIPFFTYNELCEIYNVNIIESEQEEMIWKDYGDVVGITHFPERTHPFYNMSYYGIDEKTGDKLYNKCDLIICGQETFGTAERSCDIKQMKNSFLTISDGEYSKLLFDEYGKDRVLNELDEYLSLPMIPRWGFGMGIDRLLRAMKIKNLINNEKKVDKNLVV